MATAAQNYLNQNADVKNAWDNWDTAAFGDRNAIASNADGYAQWHYDRYGRNEGRTWAATPDPQPPPTTTPPPAPTTTPGPTQPNPVPLPPPISPTPSVATPTPSFDFSGMLQPYINQLNDISRQNQVAQARASTWRVTPQQTVQHQLNGLLQQNNPLVQGMRAQGLADANSRGLLNSSMGAEAGALAHYQYAMPIATQDATTYANAARTNADNSTQVSMANAGYLNQRGDRMLGAVSDMLGNNQQGQIGMARDQYGAQVDTARSQQEFMNTAAINDRNAYNNERAAQNDYARQSSIIGQNFANSMAVVDRNFANDMLAADRDFENSLTTLGRTQAFALRENYNQFMSSIQNSFTADMTAIRTADIPVEQKEAQYQAIMAQYQLPISLVQSIYPEMPQLVLEWAE